MKRHLTTLILFLGVVFVAGCVTTQRDESYSPQGTQTKKVITKNGRITYEIHRVLDSILVEGRGRFKHKSETIARNTALNLAINDLAKRVGEVLSEEDTTLYNDDVRMFLRTRARNIVKGYTVLVDAYDIKTNTADVVIRQEGERIASIMERHIR